MNAVPQPLLHYELTTNPDPPQASPKSGASRKLALTFVVSPPDHDAVDCDRITFKFEIGASGSQNAGYLTCVADGIRTVPPNPPGQPASDWERDTGIAIPGLFSFVRTTDDITADGQGYTFTFSGIVVSPAVGTAALTVTEHSSAVGGTPVSRKHVLEVPKFPPTFGAVVFETDKPIVEPGTGTGAVLRWQGDDTAVYKLFRNGVAVTKPSPVKSPHPTGPLNEDTVFTLRVGYQAQGLNVKRDYYVTVLVANAVVNLMGPRDSVLLGEPVTLKWHTERVHDRFILGPGLPHKNVDGLSQLAVKPPKEGKAEYRLYGTTAAGETIESDFTLNVLPKPPVAKGQLVLVKTSGNKDGHVAIRVADGASQFQTGPADLATGWAEADAAGGTSLIVPFQLGKTVPDLVLVKPDSPTGWVFLHTCFSPQHGQGDDENVRTAFQPRWFADGTWHMAPMLDGSPGSGMADLVFVRTANTRLQKVEVHHATFFRAFPQVLGPAITPFPASVASKGTFLLGYISGKWSMQRPDLVFVQTAGTASGKVELSYATGGSQYGTLGTEKPAVTGFSTQNAANGSWHLADMNGDGTPDLVFVKTANTESKRVEIFIADAARGYQHLDHGFTRFDVSAGPTGTWQVLGFGSPSFPAAGAGS